MSVVSSLFNPVSTIENSYTKAFVGLFYTIFLVMASGFILMFLGAVLYAVANAISKASGLKGIGVTFLQFSFLSFSLGLFFFLGPFGAIVWTLASLWNAIGPNTFAGINWILANIWQIIGTTDQFGRRVSFLGYYVPLEFKNSDTSQWVTSFIQIGTFLKSILVPDLPTSFWTG